ncbi:MAG: hypothetical protein U0326_29845 [Polyangiales bacterium]
MSGQVCTAGRCVTSCVAGQIDCSGTCRDTTTDVNNCGACGVRCASGQVCSAGVCTVSCVSGTTNCTGVCRDLTTDNNNCGATAARAPRIRICSGSTCAVSCLAGTVNCSGVCRDLLTDNNNCGVCGRGCASGQVCSAGVCTVSCVSGTTNCTGVCRDLTTDNNNCGACGRACASGQVCSAGVCTVSCGAFEPQLLGRGTTQPPDRQQQLRRLRAGVRRAPSAPRRVHGVVHRRASRTARACAATSPPTTATAAPCRGRACVAGQVCSASVCTVSCGAGLQQLLGRVPRPHHRQQQLRRVRNGLRRTGLHGSRCVVTCQTGLTACGSTCRDLQGDNNNCGACGTVTPRGRPWRGAAR